jgi:hypothetical protein
LIAYTDAEQSRIPRTQGIYAFYLDTISPAKVGLLGHDRFNTEQLTRAKKNLVLRMNKMISFMRSSELKGTLATGGQSPHIAQFFQLQAKEIPPLQLIDLIEQMPIKLVHSYLKMANNLALFSQPIYVGITKEQTLYDRYCQHKLDHENEAGAGKFGGRLKIAGFDWDDVRFACADFKHGADTLQVLSLLEKHLQACHK